MYEVYARLRDEKGVRDATIAKATGIGRSTFSDWKNGRSTPKDEKLQKIADYLGVSAYYLRTGKEPTVIEVDRQPLEQPFETLYDTFTDEEKRFFWRSIIKEIRFGLDRKYDIVFL